MSDTPKSLVLPIYDWTDHGRKTAPYIVINAPGSPGMFMWNGYRWIDLDLPTGRYPSVTDEP